MKDQKWLICGTIMLFVFAVICVMLFCFHFLSLGEVDWQFVIVIAISLLSLLSLFFLWLSFMKEMMYFIDKGNRREMSEIQKNIKSIKDDVNSIKEKLL